MDNQPIPSSKTHLEGLTAAERFESYHYAAQPLCYAEPLRDGSTEDALCSGWLVDDITVCHCSFTWTHFRRSASQARRGGALLMEISRGEQYGEVDGRPVHIGDGRIVLRDLSRPFETVGYAEDHIGVMIPRHRIESRKWLEGRAPVVTFGVDTPAGQMLSGTMKSFMDLLPGLTRSGASSVTSGLVGLLNGLLGGERQIPGSSPIDEACLETMKMFLVQNLHDPELSVNQLTRSFHCSRAKVYRLFADEGGVAAFIRRQRLDRCRDDLSRAERTPGVVQNVAERWGFHDPYHFSRLFKRTFGVAPSGVLGSGLREDDGGGTGMVEKKTTQIHDWVLGVIETNG
ncbi:MAG: AraC family transcriptional regulator [Holophagales bacterium]|nr:AraC family transcriptional regulator [Holophagales bacterium]